MAALMRITHDELLNSWNALEGQINALPDVNQRPAIEAIRVAIKVQIDALLAAINALPVANGVVANGIANGVVANGAANGANGHMNVENGANGAVGGRRRSKKHGKKHRKSRRHH